MPFAIVSLGTNRSVAEPAVPITTDQMANAPKYAHTIYRIVQALGSVDNIDCCFAWGREGDKPGDSVGDCTDDRVPLSGEFGYGVGSIQGLSRTGEIGDSLTFGVRGVLLQIFKSSRLSERELHL